LRKENQALEKGLLPIKRIINQAKKKSISFDDG
jgi:hypothetical protein